MFVECVCEWRLSDFSISEKKYQVILSILIFEPFVRCHDISKIYYIHNYMIIIILRITRVIIYHIILNILDDA